VLILVLVAKGVIDQPGGRPPRVVDRPRDALVIGLAQVVAMWPGTSSEHGHDHRRPALLPRLLDRRRGRVLVPARAVVTLGAATAYSVLKDGSLMVDTFRTASHR